MLTSVSRPLLNEATRGSSRRHGSLKRKGILTGEVAPVERLSKRQRLFTDEYEPAVQRFASPSPPAQLIKPSDTTVERSRKRKHMSHDAPALTDHPAKRLHRSFRAAAHTGTNMDSPEPVEPPMISPCTALLARRQQARIAEHEDAGTSARLPITTESLG